MTSQVIGPALLVGHGKNEALIWLPRKEEHFFINDESAGSYKLGDWVLFDYDREKIIGQQKECPYESKVFYSNVVKQKFVQVKVPLVFCSDKQFSEVVAYSPGFGRVGAFVSNLAVDTMCFAWIAFAAFFKNAELRSLMVALELKWLLAGVDRLMAKSEIIDYPGKLGLSNSFGRCFDNVHFSRPRAFAPPLGKTARQSLPNERKKVSGGFRFASSVAHRPVLHSNLRGLIVSISSNSNILFVYTCKFPSEEFSMSRNAISIPEDVRHGSWVTFDLKIDSSGEKTVINCDLDKSPPNWAVTPVKNTIQVELTAFVPRKWRPEIMTPEERIVPTNWFDEMLDYGMLLTEDMANKSVKVLAERNKHHPTGKTWHLVKVLGIL